MSRRFRLATFASAPITAHGWRSARADDLALSIKSGRWREQLGRLFDSDVACIVLIFEGDLRNTSIPYWSVLGAVVNAELRKNAHVFRTWDRHSATNMVEHLVVVAVMIAVVQLSLSNRNSIRFSNRTRLSTTSFDYL